MNILLVNWQLVTSGKLEMVEFFIAWSQVDLGKCILIIFEPVFTLSFQNTLSYIFFFRAAYFGATFFFLIVIEA